MVFTEPAVLPIVLVSEDRVLGFTHVRKVLLVRVMRSWPGDVPVEENGEFHRHS